jgi:chemotaxis protein CheY-P-specific phosphatase CheC
MSISILICDDAKLARNQLARSLPKELDVEVSFATNGQSCLDLAAENPPDLIFLDLNMPEKDGYETLQDIQAAQLNYNVIVVSGDIQPEAEQRVLQAGAIDFVKKPIAADYMVELLQSHGFYKTLDSNTSTNQSFDNKLDINDHSTFMGVCQEVANIAMGRAASMLAHFLDVFVELPVPKVNHIELSELAMALEFTEKHSAASSVCQGFIAPGIAGEALMIFNDSSYQNIAELMKHEGEISRKVEMELLMDMANILIGSYLQGISEQLNVALSQEHPMILDPKMTISELIKNQKWSKALSFEISYSIENKGVNCDLLILFTDDCIDNLKQKMSYLL